MRTKKRENISGDDISPGRLIPQRLQSVKRTDTRSLISTRSSQDSYYQQSGQTGISNATSVDYDTYCDGTETYGTNGGGSTLISNDYYYSSLDDVSTIADEEGNLTFNTFIDGIIDVVDKDFDDEIQNDDHHYYYKDKIPKSVRAKTSSTNTTSSTATATNPKKKVRIVTSPYDSDDDSDDDSAVLRPYEFEIFGRKISLPFNCGAISPLGNNSPRSRNHNEVDNEFTTEDDQKGIKQLQRAVGFQRLVGNIKDIFIQKPSTPVKREMNKDATVMMTPSPLSVNTTDFIIPPQDDTQIKSWPNRILCFDKTELQQEELVEEIFCETTTMASF